MTEQPKPLDVPVRDMDLYQSDVAEGGDDFPELEVPGVRGLGYLHDPKAVINPPAEDDPGLNSGTAQSWRKNRDG